MNLNVSITRCKYIRRQPSRGATTAEKLKGLVPTEGACAPRPAISRAGVDAGGGCPSRCGSPGVSPRKIFENQKLFYRGCEFVATSVVRTKKQSNGNYETILAAKFLAFWKLRPISWETNTLLIPNLKIGDQSPPVPMVVAPMQPSCYQRD